ncbi:hypothetical protein EYF80_008100 [Liparis tanakae]|uniref:Uncharacterized protein n=1 Tax=Liparis tanakae TaxID=230148 RepID=A0A4Z2IVS7_9TELE|nr:hypothetical protein EYF80_008100 [Liparis tanakae]
MASLKTRIGTVGPSGLGDRCDLQAARCCRRAEDEEGAETAVELHPETDAHDPVGQRVEAHHAGHDGGAQVLQHHIIGVLVPRHRLGARAEPITAGELLAVPVGVTTLSTNQSQEVEFVQVHLQETGKHHQHTRHSREYMHTDRDTEKRILGNH